MIGRIYIFIILGMVMENCWRLFAWNGCTDDYVYYTIFPTCQRAEIALLPLWWVLSVFHPVKIRDGNHAWVYLIATTYFIFQLVDTVDMATNANQRSSILDFSLFGALNLLYWIIYKRKQQ